MKALLSGIALLTLSLGAIGSAVAQQQPAGAAGQSPAAGAEADSPAEQAPLASGVPEGQDAATAASGSADRLAGGFVAAQMEGELLSSDLVGQPLYDKAGAELGEIGDVLIDADRRLLAVVISLAAAGAAGADERLVAIPFDMLQRTVEEDKDIRLVADIDAAALQAAPTFEPLSDEAAKDDMQDLTAPSADAAGGSTPPPQ